jgi:uncharacterized protein YegJ (DUF2314 family)
VKSSIVRTASLLCALLAVGCGNDASVVQRSGQPAVVAFDNRDGEMAAAIREARDSVQGFIGELPALRGRGDYVAIKVAIPGGPGTEHVWLASPAFSDGAFHGVIDNVPLGGRLKLGDSVTVKVSEISDWMAVRQGELYGGFTVILARARMSSAERAKFDAGAPFRVPATARRF